MRRMIVIEGDGDLITRRAQKYNATVAIHASSNPDERTEWNDPGVRLVVDPDGAWALFDMPQGGSGQQEVLLTGQIKPKPQG